MTLRSYHISKMKMLITVAALVFLNAGCAAINNNTPHFFSTEKWTLKFENNGAQFYSKVGAVDAGIEPSSLDNKSPDPLQMEAFPLTKEIDELKAEHIRIRAWLEYLIESAAYEKTICEMVSRANTAAVRSFDSVVQVAQATQTNVSIPYFVDPLQSVNQCNQLDQNLRFQISIENSLRVLEQFFSDSLSGDLSLMQGALLGLGNLWLACNQQLVEQRPDIAKSNQCVLTPIHFHVIGSLLEKFLRVSAISDQSSLALTTKYEARQTGEELRQDMSREELVSLSFWGVPEHGINSVHRVDHVQEQWIYKLSDAPLDYAFIYFENGKLIQAMRN